MLVYKLFPYESKITCFQQKKETHSHVFYFFKYGKETIPHVCLVDTRGEKKRQVSPGAVLLTADQGSKQAQ